MSRKMYVLHYAPDNASLIIRYVLETARIPYTTALVNRATRQQDSSAYRALNPTGLIPTLETPHGPLSETAAILLWLADTHALGPSAHDLARGTFLKTLFFISNTAHADMRQLFYPDQYVPETAIPAHHAIMTVRMRRHFALLDQAATDHPALFAPTGILTPYICALMRWSVLYPRGQDHWFDLHRFPALQAMAHAVEATPAAIAVAGAEGLGDAPFTQPVYARPRVGSAT
jgi:glutathione S-transferase